MAFDSSEYKWNDISLFINGQRIAKFTAIRETLGVQVDEVRGEGDDPIDLQAGNRTYGLMVTMHKTQVDKMNRAAVGAGGRDLCDIAWQIVWDFRPVIGAPRQTNTYSVVRFEGYEAGMEQGAPSMPIVLNGKTLRPQRT